MLDDLLREAFERAFCERHISPQYPSQDKVREFLLLRNDKGEYSLFAVNQQWIGFQLAAPAFEAGRAPLEGFEEWKAKYLATAEASDPFVDDLERAWQAAASLPGELEIIQSHRWALIPTVDRKWCIEGSFPAGGGDYQEIELSREATISEAVAKALSALSFKEGD